MFDPINLDSLSTDPNDYHTIARVLDTLAEYARRKAEAMKLRMNGEIDRAAVIELGSLVKLYSVLPVWACW